MSQLPNGWTKTNISELGDMVGGKTPSKAEPRFWADGTIPWVSPKDMKVFDLAGSEDQISESAINDGGMNLLPAESILMVTRSGILAHTFPVAITKAAVTINQDIKAIAPAEAFNTRYLAYNLKSQQRTILNDCAKSGTTVASVETEQLKKLPITLAPLPEQKRIADKLDSMLARVDACRDRLDRLPALLKRFRQSILAAATSGQLTKDWRLASGHGEISTYSTTKLSTIATSRLGKMLDKAKNSGRPTPYLRNVNVRWFGFDLSDIQEMRIEDSEREALLVKTGDLLICEGGEPGRCAIWQGEDGRFIFQKALHRVRPDPNVLSSLWLAYSLKYSADNNTLEDLFTGTTIKHLTGVALANFEIPLPPLDEQTEIVRRVEILFAFADRLEARLATARRQVGQLTPALLAKAFRGELVPQDPSDEPAAELLKRLAAQREAAPKPKRGRAKA